MIENKKDVYFLSGTMCNEKLWQEVFALSSSINPIYIDTTAGSSFEEISRIIDSKIKEDAILVGFSMGAFAALRYTIFHPRKVSKLILLAVDSEGLNAKEIELRKSTIHFLEKHPYKGVASSRIKQFLHPDHFKHQYMVDVIKEMDRDLGKEVLLRQLTATSFRDSLTDKLDRIKIPTLLLSGDSDALISSDKMELMKNKIEDAIHIKIENSGHMLPLEQPMEVIYSIEDFIE
ncbi:alpha/beta fold hydrolase [Aureivirga sp. CE67]|uniref:alpha/beta fold hydrolase n=1 Tax=Aureivirga sp. CE67 TaxID=1788983 RepID=UPI0018CA9715|nr:alpha/beta hydrolase [Aureivirga sp. CE67]